MLANEKTILLIAVTATVLMLAILVLNLGENDAETFQEGQYRFTIIDNDGVRIDSYELDGGTLQIPNTATYAEKTYKVKEIGPNVFKDRSGLFGEISLPEYLERIGEYAFYNCSGLFGALKIPNSVEYIGDYAFYNCKKFTQLTLPKKMDYLGEGAFCGCEHVSGNWEVPTGLTTIKDYCFKRCSPHSRLIIPDGITEIGKEAFYNISCDRLILPDSLKKISDEAFYNLILNDQIIDIPGSVEYIGKRAFYEVDPVVVYIEEGVKTLSDECFNLNYNVKYVQIPKSISYLSPTTFGNRPFYSADGKEIEKTIERLTGHYFVSIDDKMICDGPGPRYFKISIKTEPEEACRSVNSGLYQEGSNVDVRLSLNERYLFREWNDGVTVQNRTIYIQGNMNLIAYIDRIYTVKLESEPYNSCMFLGIYGKEQFTEGTELTITVRPVTGKKLMKWSDGVTEDTRTIIVDRDYNLTAILGIVHNVNYYDPEPMKVYSEEIFEGEKFTIANNERKKEGYEFMYWTMSGKNYYPGDIVTMETYSMHFQAEWKRIGTTDDQSLLIVASGVCIVLLSALLAIYVRKRI